MNQAHIQRLTDTLVDLESDLESRGAAMRERTRGVGALIRILVASMGILALANLYFVNALAEDVKLMILAMQEMTGHFAQVARRMDDMSDTIDGMERSVALMPVIRDQMGEIGTLVRELGSDVAGMRTSAGRMDATMDGLNLGVSDMAQRFRGLNRSVAGLGEDVDQMARPIP